MKVKKVTALLLALIMSASMVLGGCGSSDGGAPEGTSSAGSTQSSSEAGGSEADGSVTDSSDLELLTLEVYDVAANYQGIQSGWFGKVIKDKFNIELNIFAPNISGDPASLYQTRASSGKLGDIILLDNSDFIDCINAGLVKDISDGIFSYTNLIDYEDQIRTLNKELSDEDKIYGIPTEMTNTSPDGYSETSIFSTPSLHWDYYRDLGSPKLNNLDDLLDLLELMQKTYPTNDAGDPAYAIGLWKDWDGFGMENVLQILKWYGEEANDSILISVNNTIRPLMDEDGGYYKILKFLFEANQRGLIDPDSSIHDWTTYDAEKLRQKRIYLGWYSWGQNLANIRLNDELNAAGEGMISVPVADMHFYQVADSYYGTGRVWGVGAHVDEKAEARILEFLDWLAGPEAMTYMWAGVEGLTYEVREDGKYKLTDDTFDYIGGNKAVPEEYGTGGFADGMSKLNQYISSSLSINPITGDPYSSGYWTSQLEKPKVQRAVEWTERFEAGNILEYTQEHDMITLLPNINTILESDTTDIALTRSQCATEITSASWQMVFAANEAEFTGLWNNLQRILTGLGYDSLVEFDTAKYQKVIDARKAAMGN